MSIQSSYCLNIKYYIPFRGVALKPPVGAHRPCTLNERTKELDPRMRSIIYDDSIVEYVLKAKLTFDVKGMMSHMVR